MPRGRSAAAGAVVAGNGALWALLNQKSFNFLEHPQFWLIPPALSVLLAAHLNRKRLEPQVMTAIRYAATLSPDGAGYIRLRYAARGEAMDYLGFRP